jgi:hypothetical protein
MRQQLDIKFRFQPLRSSPDGILLDYIKNCQELDAFSNEMVLKALRAYWLADAYHDCGAKKGQHLKKLAINMIFALEEHANYLRTVFGIERIQPMYQVPPSAPVFQAVPQEEEEEEEDDEKTSPFNSIPRIDGGGL